MKILLLLFANIAFGKGPPPSRPKPGEEWTNALGTIFCWCPPEGDIKQGFWLGKYEATKREFDLVTPKKPKGALAKVPDDPRDSIRYDDVQQYVRELNRREHFYKRIPEGWEYALPSEAEWEHACRAGTRTHYYFGEDANELIKHANFADRRLLMTGNDTFHYAIRDLDDGTACLAKGGSYAANLWGLHDMLGNLWEWTADHDQTSAVARGGSWVSLPEYCEPGLSRSFKITTEQNFIGFRVALKRVAKAE